MTHTTYKLSKALKKFLKESAPEPMDNDWWYKHSSQGWIVALGESIDITPTTIPAYQLHDLLSKPFCAEMRLACKWGDNSLSAANRGIEMVHDVLSMAYFHGGLPAVEKALFEMMGHKEDK